MAHRLFRRSDRKRIKRPLTLESLEERSLLSGTTQPGFIPTRIEADDHGVIYLLSADNDRVYRYSTRANADLEAIEVGSGPQHLAYSPLRDQLYVGYASGAVTRIDVQAAIPAEVSFVVTAGAVTGLEAAGPVIFVTDTSSGASHYTYSGNGSLISHHPSARSGEAFEWSSATSRVYYTSTNVSPADLHWDLIDGFTGQLIDTGDSPYHGDYEIQPPVRVSRDGSRVLLGSGDVYDGISLKILKSLPGPYVDALWLADGSFITLQNQGGHTRLEHRDSDYRLFNSTSYSGTPLRVLETNGEVIVVVQQGGRPNFIEFVPTDDVDGDGVDYRHDAFPSDKAASQDRDRDGAPDAWNLGSGPQDSTTRLQLDAFPLDSACQHFSQAVAGDTSVCDIGANIPVHFPDARNIVVDESGVIYVVALGLKHIFRWSPAQNAHLNPIIVEDIPRKLAYSAENNRLYVSYDSGRITQIDLRVELSPELPFADFPTGVESLQTVGPFVFVATSQGSSNIHTLLTPNGLQGSTANWRETAREYVWNAARSRMYYGVRGLYWEEINPQTGEIIDQGRGSYSDFDYTQAPLRISQDGSRLIFGSGEIFDAGSLQLLDWLPDSFSDAAWLADGSLVSIRFADDRTLLEHWDANLELLNSQTFAGAPVRVLEVGNQITVITRVAERTAFSLYVATDDVDHDGVSHSSDAFPQDPAASFDTDNDGYPDQWNAGYSAQQSTSGLVLDAFPRDSACQLAEQAIAGQPTVCDIAAQIPAYTPAHIESDADGIIYLLPVDGDRIYRWSSHEKQYLNPIVLDDRPRAFVHSNDNARLYVGYANGVIKQIEARAEFPAERRFAKTRSRLNELQSVGPFLFAESVGDDSPYGYTQSLFRSDGTLVSSAQDSRAANAYIWSPAGRMFYIGKGSPQDVQWIAIDPVTGAFGARGDSPYHGDFDVHDPIRASIGGDLLLLGGGEILDAVSLKVLTALRYPVSDAVWLADDELITLRNSNGQTLVEHWSDQRQLLDLAVFDGSPLRILSSDQRIIVVGFHNNRPVLNEYVPTEDRDEDGVLNWEDAFPGDRAAAIDRDYDGYPDAWNDGRRAQDSVLGLVLDAFPRDSACQLPEHSLPGQVEVCDIAARIPAYEPTQIEISPAGVVYLLSPEHDRVFRWSLQDGAHLNPIVVGDAPSQMAYSAENDRLYLSYKNTVTEIDLTEELPAEQFFTTTPWPIRTIRMAGPIVFVSDASRYEVSHYTFAADGSLLAQDGERFGAGASEFEWNPATQRMYSRSIWGVTWEQINLATGEIVHASDHLRITVSPPLRISSDGARLVDSTGDVFNASTGEFIDSLPIQYVDAMWQADGSLITVRAMIDGRTLLEHWDSQGGLYNWQYYAGRPVRVGPAEGRILLVTQKDNRPAFAEYVPSNDADSDGVLNPADAFVWDPAAAVDRDGDGYPDAWNEGRGESDSTEGLKLDAFPDDAACQLPVHAISGQPAVCDIQGNIPAFTVQRMTSDDAGVIYLLSREHDRIFRWSTAIDKFLNPIVLSDNPQALAYSAQNERLYVGYANGNIGQIDITVPVPREVFFAETPDNVSGLQAAGRFVFAVDDVLNSSERVHYTFAPDGAKVSTRNVQDASLDFAWSPANERMYYITDESSPRDLHWEPIDAETGAIGRSQDSPYHGEKEFQQPIRVSPDGSVVLAGSGNLFDAITLTFINSLPAAITDAVWLDRSSVVTIRDTGSGNSLVEQWDGTLRLLNSSTIAGVPVHLLEAGGELTVVSQHGGRLRFSEFIPDTDADDDGVANVADDFPLDVAASRDTDGDAFPNEWNVGYTERDSTTGLRLDVFPEDVACQLAEHAAPRQADICLPEFVPSRIVMDFREVIYLFDEQFERVHRWSVREDRYLSPLQLGDEPRDLAYSRDHDKLYVGYDSGAITQVDLSVGSPVEASFATVPSPVTGLQAAGSLLVAAYQPAYRFVHHTFAADGTSLFTTESYDSATLEWSGVNQRLYLARDDVYPNDVSWEAINPATGEFTAKRESYYHGDYVIRHPLRVSFDGELLVLGSSDVYDADTLTYRTALPVVSFTDAHWREDGGLVTVRALSEDRTMLERWDAKFQLFNLQSFPGSPLSVLPFGGESLLVTLQSGRPAFHRYLPPRENLVAAANGVVTGPATLEYALHIAQGPKHGIYSLQFWRDGNSTTNSTRLEIRNNLGESMPVRQSEIEIERNGEVGTAVVVELPPGDYVVRVGIAEEISGAYRLELQLPGALNGERQVVSQNRRWAELALLQNMFGLDASAQDYFGKWTNLDLRVTQFRSEFDANLDGRIDSMDVRSILDNSADDAPPSIAVFNKLVPSAAEVVDSRADYTLQLKLSEFSFSVHRNPQNAIDVNADGKGTPIDALIVINSLNEDGPRTLDVALDAPLNRGLGNAISAKFYDVSGDYFLSPIDALIVINDLNNRSVAEGEMPLDERLLLPPLAANLDCAGHTEPWVRSTTHLKLPRSVPRPSDGISGGNLGPRGMRHLSAVMDLERRQAIDVLLRDSFDELFADEEPSVLDSFLCLLKSSARSV